MGVLDDIKNGKGLKPITYNCFTCQNDNCIVNSEKIATYQCPDYKHKKTNADCIRAKTDEGLAEWMENNGDCPPIPCPYSGNNKPLTRDMCLNCTLKWLKEEVEE